MTTIAQRMVGPLLILVLIASCLAENCRTPDGVAGKCIFLKACPELVKRIRRGTLQDVKFVQDSGCGFQQSAPRVCCAENTTKKPPPDVKPNGGVVDVSSHSNLRLLGLEDCGESAGIRIINGSEAGISEFPWMAMLLYDSFGTVVPRCGGTVISDKYILTAAHCISKTLVSVRLGEHDFNTDIDCDNFTGCVDAPQNFEIEERILHPQYKENTKGYTDDKFLYDIALLRLKGQVKFTETVRPICLPIGLQEQTRQFHDSNLTVAGWGVTEKGLSSNVLMMVHLPFMPIKSCAEHYAGQAPITETQICAGGKDRRDACTGDSGGPLMTPGELRGATKMLQYGIVSFGPDKCGDEVKPSVYTRVGFFMDWILNNLRP